jgi:hypothetical protein
VKLPLAAISACRHSIRPMSVCQGKPICRISAGHYSTADAGMIDEEGYVSVMSRTDDIINVAGHRLSTGGDGRSAGGASAISPNAPWLACAIR